MKDRVWTIVLEAIWLSVAVVALVSAIYLVWPDIKAIYENYFKYDRTIYFLPISILALGIALIRPVVCISRWQKPIIPIALITGVWTGLAIFSSLYFLFKVDIDPASREYLSRYMSIPTILVAAWVAGMGWFIHQYYSSKAHRVNNSFNVLMQFQTNSELRRAHRRVAHTLPQNCEGYLDNAYRLQMEIKVCRDALKAAKSDGAVQKIEDSRAKLSESLAIRDLFYLLNYFEFVAVGIKKRELDESLLYETIRPQVIAFHEKAAIAIGQMRESEGTPKVFCELRDLITYWNKKYAEECEIKGLNATPVVEPQNLLAHPDHNP